jgi:hypothetical protein
LKYYTELGVEFRDGKPIYNFPPYIIASVLCMFQVDSTYAQRCTQICEVDWVLFTCFNVELSLTLITFNFNQTFNQAFNFNFNFNQKPISVIFCQFCTRRCFADRYGANNSLWVLSLFFTGYPMTSSLGILKKLCLAQHVCFCVLHRVTLCFTLAIKRLITLRNLMVFMLTLCYQMRRTYLHLFPWSYYEVLLCAKSATLLHCV